MQLRLAPVGVRTIIDAAILGIRERAVRNRLTIEIAVADEVTEDPSGKGKGGDLGYFTKDQMVPEFANVAFALDKGKISGPVKTQFGWHVIKVTDKREKPKPSFEDVKPQVEQFVARKAQADFVTKLRADAKIVKNYKVEEPKSDTPKADAPAAPAAPKQ